MGQIVSIFQCVQSLCLRGIFQICLSANKLPLPPPTLINNTSVRYSFSAMKIENIINYSCCHPLTAPAIVLQPESGLIVSLPSGHLFFTVSMGMSSMRVPQKLREMQACIAKLPPQQRIRHPEEPPSLTRKTQSADPPRAPRQRSGSSVSQDRVGTLFFSDWLQFCNTEKHPSRGDTGIFSFNPSSLRPGVLKVPDWRGDSCS